MIRVGVVMVRSSGQPYQRRILFSIMRFMT
jgi:hypothetical protein